MQHLGPVPMMRNGGHRLKPHPPEKLMLELNEAQIEAAARYMARCEGLNPDTMTVKDRPQWHVYADMLRGAILPAINHALAGVTPEGKSDVCLHDDEAEDS